MKFTIEIDTDTAPAVTVGEFLRRKFWPPQPQYSKYGPSETYGCYSEFTYGPDVKVLPSRVEERADIYRGEKWIERIEWNRAEWNGILCEWYWDGDGVLRFSLPNGSRLYNGDCEKDYTWEWEEDPE